MNILTFDIGVTNIRYALCVEQFRLSDVHTVPTRAQQGGQQIMERLLEIIGTYQNIDRVAVSTVGQVDSQNGIVVYSAGNIPYYTGMMIKKRIENDTGLPTYVENDVNAAALGEAHFGAGQGQKDFLCLMYGTGIGGALYLNGQLYKGSASCAAEFGHMITHAGGLDCPCGGKGCYERYASTKALIEKVRTATNKPLDAFTIFEKENLQDPAVRAVVDQWIDELILGLTNLIYIFNPPLVILGGGVINEDYIIELIDRKIYKNMMENYKKVNIVRTKLGSTAGLLGAAYAAAQL